MNVNITRPEYRCYFCKKINRAITKIEEMSPFKNVKEKVEKESKKSIIVRMECLRGIGHLLHLKYELDLIII